MELQGNVGNIVTMYEMFCGKLWTIQDGPSPIAAKQEYLKWLSDHEIDPDFQKEMEWLVTDVVCSAEAVQGLTSILEKKPTFADVIIDPAVLETLGEYYYGTMARDIEASLDEIQAIVSGQFNLKEHFCMLDKQYVREEVDVRERSSSYENLYFAAARILARENAETYSSIQRDLGYIDSLETAPAGTRDRINEAFEKRLTWSKDKPRAYICSPLSASDRAGIHQNMLAARRYCEVAERQLLVDGKAPHAWLPEFLDDHNPGERRIALDVGIGMLRASDCCLVCGDRISMGMKSEIQLAGQMDIRVFTFSDKAKEAVFDILGETKNHTHVAPFVTSDLSLLAKSPEEINGMRLDSADCRFQDQHLSQTMQKTFEKRFEQELGMLSYYEDYRRNRDHGGDTIRAYDEQMQGIETKILKASEQVGIERNDASVLLKASLDNPILSRAKVLDEGKEVDQSLNRNRGR